jgi:iron(III) transport system permease protein
MSAIALRLPGRPLPRPSIDWQKVVLGAIVALLAYLALGPLALLLFGMFRDAPPGAAGAFTLDKVKEAYTEPEVYTSLFNTVVYAGGTTVLSTVLGGSLAWIHERTNVPFRHLIFSLSIVRVVIPMMLAVIGWILLLSPNIGLVNQALMHLFGLQSPPINIYGRLGMIWCEGIDLLPISFLLSIVAFHSIDPAQEEAAAMAGAGPLRAFWRVSLRLASPGLLAGALIVFLDAFDSIEAPTFIGLRAHLPTLSTAVYEATDGTPSDINLASAYGAGFLVLAAIGLWLYQRISARSSRFSTIGGQNYRARRFDLGARRRYVAGGLCLAVLVFGFGLPVLVLLWASLLPFYQAPSLQALHRASLQNYAFILHYPTTLRALRNSMLLAAGSATVGSLLTMAAAWLVVRSGNRRGRMLDMLIFLPKAFPGVVLGLSLLWIYITLPFNLYGTLWVIGIAYVTRFMPMGMRFSHAAMVQLKPELEEAGHVSGAPWTSTFGRIIVPLMMSGFVTSWIYIAAYSFRELSASILLASPGSEVAAVTVFDLWNNGQTGPVAAFCITMLVLLLGLFTLLRVLAGRFDVHPLEQA